MILHGDCLIKLKELEDNSVDSIVTDPPYELGFMSKNWDSTGIAYDIELWSECLRVLKPGGHLLAFSGTRTYHRMTVAIEDAGFEVRDMVEWVYGSGFPKSLNIGKAVDKLEGNEREFISENYRGKNADKKSGIMGETVERIDTVTKGHSPWEGWGTALKPAHEPICLARKPLSEKSVAQNVLKWGTGGLNIDKSRVDFIDDNDKKLGQSARPSKTSNSNDYALNHGGLEGMDRSDRSNVTGRFPANLLHDNSDEVVREFPNTKGEIHNKLASSIFGNDDGGGIRGFSVKDSGSAARFFKSFVYCAKASKSERDRGCDKNNHPTVKPLALMKYLIEMITPPGGVVLDPFAGSGSTLVAAKELGYDFIGIEMTEEYIPIIEARLAAVKNVQSTLLKM
jgi:DNA modification methylase